MEAKVTWKGAQVLAEIEGATADGLWQAGMQLLAAAKSRAPKLTGRLRESGYVAAKNRSTYVYRRGWKKEKRPTDPNTVIVAFSAPHSHLQEFGTVKMRARPFLRPAFDERRESIKADVVRVIRARRGQR